MELQHIVKGEWNNFQMSVSILCKINFQRKRFSSEGSSKKVAPELHNNSFLFTLGNALHSNLLVEYKSVTSPLLHRKSIEKKVRSCHNVSYVTITLEKENRGFQAKNEQFLFLVGRRKGGGGRIQFVLAKCQSTEIKRLSFENENHRFFS